MAPPGRSTTPADEFALAAAGTARHSVKRTYGSGSARSAKVQAPEEESDEEEEVVTAPAPSRATPSKSKEARTPTRPAVVVPPKVLSASRSTRNNRQPYIDIRLEGAPPAKPSPKKSAPRKAPASTSATTREGSGQKRAREDSRRSTSKSPSKKKPRYAESDTSDSDDSAAAVEQLLKRSPSKRTLTPSKLKARSSLNKPSTSARKASTSASATASTSRKQLDDDEGSDDELALPPSPALAPSRRSTPASARTPSPTKPATPTSSRYAGGSSANRRSSIRAQLLPVSKADIENVPKELRSVLVGYHQEDAYRSPSKRGSSDRAGSEAMKQDEDEEVQSEEEGSVRSKGKGKGKDVKRHRRAVSQEILSGGEDELIPSASGSRSRAAFSRVHADSDEDDLHISGRPPSAIVAPRASASVSPVKRAHPRDKEHTTEYSTRLLSAIYEQNLAILSGGALPEPRPSAAASLSRDDDSNEQQIETETADLMQQPYLSPIYQKWEQPLRFALRSVVQEGMGQCLLLLGPRGVGKSMIINRTLHLLARSVPSGDEDDDNSKEKFITIRLSGLLHTTDRIALRSMAYQLGKQGQEVEGEVGSNAALMSTLLSLLEPPTSSNSTSTTKPIIIILDEFDLFAQHPRQSFLYCLLDIVQGNRRRGGLGVVGVSCRSDTLSILEKRVRSRCQSQVHQMILPADFSSYLSLSAELMGVDSELWNAQGDEEGKLAAEWEGEVTAFLKEKKTQEYFKRLWQVHGNTPTQLRAAIAHLFFHLSQSLSQGTEGEGGKVTPGPERSNVPSLRLTMLPLEEKGGGRGDLGLGHLTILELNVLIAAKHLRSKHDNTLNLEMLYRCYLEHVQRGKINVGSKAFSRAAFCMAFDHLRQLELFLPHTGKPSHHIAPSAANPFRMYRLVPWDSTLEEAIKSRSEQGGKRDVPEELKKWLKDWAA